MTGYFLILSTGSLSGIAPEDALGSSYSFTIDVSDGQNQTSLGPLSFSVNPPIFFISFDLLIWIHIEIWILN